MDLARVRACLLVGPDDPSTPGDAVFCDLDGSNRINALDVLLTRRHLFRTLPAPPAPPSAPAAAAPPGPARPRRW